MILQDLLRLRKYRPQPATLKSVFDWLRQFEFSDWTNLLKLLAAIRFVTEEETRKLLVEKNDEILAVLKDAGITHSSVVYIQFDDAGSSSAVMLNILKEAALLERAGCEFVDAKDIDSIVEKTRRIGVGAVIYVDDFVGTGRQLCRARDFAKEYYQGEFTEFVLCACICDEAIVQCEERGVETYAGFVHGIRERALQASADLLPVGVKRRLLELGREWDPKWSLGFRNMASMVVFYRNCPNGTPVLLRGSVGQSPFVGVIPRITDLPARK